MLMNEPQRGTYYASLLPVVEGILQPPHGHPFPALHLAKHDGATVYGYYIDLAGTLPEVSFYNTITLPDEILAREPLARSTDIDSGKASSCQRSVLVGCLLLIQFLGVHRAGNKELLFR